MLIIHITQQHTYVPSIKFFLQLMDKENFFLLYLLETVQQIIKKKQKVSMVFYNILFIIKDNPSRNYRNVYLQCHISLLLSTSNLGI